MRYASIADLPEQHRTEALAQMDDGSLYTSPVRAPDMRPASPQAQTVSEHDEQVAVFRWAALHSSRWPCLERLFAIPNGGKRGAVTAMKLKAEGVKAGVPDIFLPWPTGGWCGLWIEIKVGSNKPTENQRECLAWLGLNGYQTATCWGADEAIRVIEKYLRGDSE